MTYRLASILVDSWDEATRMAREESAHAKRPYYAVEYREFDSVDGMTFFEACSPNSYDMLQKNYAIVKVEVYKNN